VITSFKVLIAVLLVIITSMELLREEFRENEDIWTRMDSIQVWCSTRMMSSVVTTLYIHDMCIDGVRADGRVGGGTAQAV
jgi:hypothetical protein